MSVRSSRGASQTDRLTDDLKTITLSTEAGYKKAGFLETQLCIRLNQMEVLLQFHFIYLFIP